MGISKSCARYIEVTGRPVRARFEIKFNGTSVFLSGTSFFYFFQLAWYAKHHPGKWLQKEEIEDTGNQARYLYRLRREIENNYASCYVTVENNRHGAYRLAVDSYQLHFDAMYLRSHPDARIRSRFGLRKTFGKPLEGQSDSA